MTSDPWGRVDEQGTVYVRTAEGERPVGSWQAGDAEEALAFFHRKYDALVTEIDLLEQRLQSTDLPPSQAQASVRRLKGEVRDAKAVGDLEALEARLDQLDEFVQKRKEEVRAARQQARTTAREEKERIVGEAERIAAQGSHWKAGGQRFRELVEEWKVAGRVDRPTESALWKRFSAARNQFGKRRKAYFREIRAQREHARTRKEELVSEAERVAGATDWGPTASHYRQLMREWRAAGPATPDAEEALWSRFKSAQDTFFHARSEAFAERDSEQREHQTKKEELLGEAERLLPVRDARSARASLRRIQDRWDQIGPAPRGARDRLEGRLRRVEEAIRSAEGASWHRANPDKQARAEDTIARLRESIVSLERQLGQARAKGKDEEVRRTGEALAARRTWLEEAERTLADLATGGRRAQS
ncbi:MAG: DUF349 domain-containing protein [Streptosporangiaceae bacterium]